MKLSTIFLVSVLGLSSAAYAWGGRQNNVDNGYCMGQNRGKQMGQGQHNFGKGNHVGRGQRMVEFLKLSPEQATKLQEIIKATPINKDASEQDITKMRNDRHQKILAILTPEQKKIFEDRIKSRGFSVK